jgi:hypothetical protein
MLQQLLKEIRTGGTLETHALAKRLGTTPQIVRAMLEHLDRLGLVEAYADCSDGCRGCDLSPSCGHTAQGRLWKSHTSM